MNLKGRVLENREIELIQNEFDKIDYPEKLISILKDKPIIGEIFELSEDMDASGLGCELQIMSIEEQIEEFKDMFPGKVAIKYGYIPFGKCLEGSGDPYFIKSVNGLLNIYRIPHDIIFEDKLNEEDIDYICTSQELLESKE